VPGRSLPLARQALPAGVELYRLGAGGEIELVTADGVRRLDRDGRLLHFIDDGQGAHYLIGGADSGPERPSRATVKFGVVAPHSAFRPASPGGAASTRATAPRSGWYSPSSCGCAPTWTEILTRS
jgi:hypothetical protein